MENDLYNDIIAKNKCKFLEKYNPETTSLDTNTGGEFVVYNKDDIDKINELGKIYLYYGEPYIINNNIKQVIPMPYRKLKNYIIYFKDVQKPEGLQPVSIKDDDEIEIENNNSIILSFQNILGKYLHTIMYQNKESKQIEEYYCNGNIQSIEFQINNIPQHGIWFSRRGKKIQEGTCKCNEINKTLELYGKNCKYYFPITIQHGEFAEQWLYSGSAYLRENLQDEEIKEENKIYTLNTNEDHVGGLTKETRTLTFYTTNPKIGLDRDIVINIDENNIATLQGEPLTEDNIKKIKKFFNNIPLEQLDNFDNYLSTLYYTTIINKEKYKNINILIPDLCEYKYKTDKETKQTINLINQIPQDKRNGKYIIPCDWLKYAHQVNLIIDFDNKIFEIVNTGANVDQEVINNLQQELRNNFKEENWIAYENNIITQSTNNCVITSNIVATEKVMLEKKIEEYNKKEEQLGECNEQLKRELEITKTQNTKGEDVDINDVVDEFFKEYNIQTKQIIKNLKQNTIDLEQEQKTLIKNMFLLKQRVLEQFNMQFNEELDLFKNCIVGAL